MKSFAVVKLIPLLLFCHWLLPAAAAVSAEIQGPLVIVTSFPKTLFSRYKEAFEKRHPEVSVFIRSKKTTTAITFVQERQSEPVDIFWASSPDAFEVLKKTGDLVPFFKPSVAGAANIGGYPLDDPDGCYRGFAVSGFGITWNTTYLKQYKLEVPKSWDDLKRPEYGKHVGISAPSRSGTTHLIVETILQGKGWQEGWALLLEMGGNLATVTARSFGVPAGVEDGRFGIGPVIDFFGLSARRTGAAMDFVYPDNTVYLPANIGIVKRSSNREAALAFVDFVLSTEGQKILFEPQISRLPVDREIYQSAPADYPNPFSETFAAKGIGFDTELSRKRYHVVNGLFDIMITYRLKALRRAWKGIHRAEKNLADHPASLPRLEAKLSRARRLAAGVVISETQASAESLVSVYRPRKPGLPISAHQVDREHDWQKMSRQNLTEALRLAEEILEELTLLEAEKKDDR
ncbi:MAG: extracellular solute-binding protein [Thermodesulfobacteriota bacterium]